MLQQLRQARKNESGFTLIELLIVIVILGVLSGIVVFAVSGIQDRGNQAACRTDVKTIEVAQEAFYAKSTPGAYADSVQALIDGGLLRGPVPVGVTTRASDGAVALTRPGCTTIAYPAP